MHWKVWLPVLLVFAIHLYILHHLMAFSWRIALEDGATSTAIISLSVWSIFLLIRSYPTTAMIYPYALLIALMMSVLTSVAELEVLKLWVIRESPDYKPWVTQTLPIRFLFIVILNCWVATNGALQKHINTLDQRFQQQTDASVLLKEAELFKLRQQLQPHFLYNSLNSISALIVLSPEKAQEMIGKLSDFLRSSVQRESEDILPIAEELDYIQSYLSIESIRFGDRLRVRIERNYKEGATLPPFLLQPVLENAIKFGLYGKTGVVEITISITSDDATLIITITNPYDKDLQPPRGTGFGLEGIRRRLYLIYARTDLLEIKRDEQNFQTILKIPQIHVQGHSD